MSDFKVDAANLRKHGKRNKALVKRSLVEVGAGRSILVDGEGVVRCGNETYTQARALGLEVLEVHTKQNQLVAVVRDDLTGDAAKRMAAYDNRTAELSQWDNAAVHELAEKQAAAIAGLFNKDELRRIAVKARGTKGKHPTGDGGITDLLKHLVYSPTFNKTRSVRHLSCRKWDRRTKPRDIDLWHAAKAASDTDILAAAGREIAGLVKEFLGACGAWYVTCPPAGASAGKHTHFGSLLAQLVAELLGVEFVALFADRPRDTPSHPRTYDQRGACVLDVVPPAAPCILLVDDVATSGKTLEDSVGAIRAASVGQAIMPVVWIYQDVEGDDGEEPA